MSAFNGPKFVCDSDLGSITLYYNDSNLTSYIVNNMTYELEEQKKVVKRTWS